MINHDKLHQLWWFSWVTSVIYHDIPSSSFRLVETLGLLLEITFVTTLVVYFFIFIGLKWADSPFVAHLSLGISDSGLGAPLQFSNAFRNHGTFRNGRKNWIELDLSFSFLMPLTLSLESLCEWMGWAKPWWTTTAPFNVHPIKDVLCVGDHPFTHGSQYGCAPSCGIDLNCCASGGGGHPADPPPRARKKTQPQTIGI